ncbi:ser thr protein phosphatase [Moniliophthora roreri MCA 2997]|uniref:Ser thr protein phosphatase n=2 Tax=Moniliophthora roreri TaxID=221103 RepID=V2X5A3_MONRO|nr:ser thr protein phosphatase [Moniliophthora roreri MCA 2997]KAI3616765.1 ser thr protein phosphatase [Moniliophthora roreri]
MATTVLDSEHGRILCIADIRGNLSSLNDLARDANAAAIIHTGDFGFFESSSLDRINDRTLRHLAMYSPLIPPNQRTHLLQQENAPQHIRQSISISLLSEFPLLLSNQIKLDFPVYTVWGACEDVQILEKFRMGTYSIPNLFILDEAQTGTHLLHIAGLKLRLFGLGGALVPHKMFDNGDASATIAGGQGTMWTTALQIGQLVDTAQRAFDPSETRLLVSHASPGREGIIAQLALVLKADLTISAGLHFRYASSYNEFSVSSDYEGFRHKLTTGKEQFDKVWESVKSQVDAVIDEHQRILLDKALYVVERVPPSLGSTVTTAQGAQIQAQDEPAWKNTWNWNLCDAAYGCLVLDVKEGRVSAELKSQGFNYAYRRTASTPAPAAPTSMTPEEKAATPVPAATEKAPTPAPASAPATEKAPAPAPAQSPRAIPPHLAGVKGGSGRGSPSNASGRGTPTTAAVTNPSGRGTPSVAAPDTSAPNTPTSVQSPSTATAAEKDKDKEKEKAERKREKKKEKREKEKEREKEKAATGESTPSQGHKPQLSTDEVKSPKSPRPKGKERNPWTIFIRSSVSTTEEDLREFFGDAKGGITKISFPQTTNAGRAQKLAYVEFSNEESMQTGLSSHAEKLNDAVPEVKQATDKETRDREREKEKEKEGGFTPNPAFNSGSVRGRGRGRGGGGGFAQRGLAMAGLTGGGRGRGGSAGGSASGSDVQGAAPSA